MSETSVCDNNRSIPSNAGANIQAQFMPNQFDMDQIAEFSPQS
jgi:hypothetical protein